jgi:hypothetical protein
MQRVLMILLIALMGLPAVKTLQEPIHSRLFLTHVTVIDATGSLPKPDMTVEINEGQISSIRSSSEAFIPNDAVVVDATGKFLIPGLWDMHVHLLQEERIKKSFPMLLANGVLGIRDMGSPSEELEKISQWRGQIETGEISGPHIIASGPMIDGATPMFAHLSISAKDEIEARQDVDFLKQSGVDFIKVYSLLSRKAYFAIADEAKKQHIPFAGHVPDSVSALEAANAGQRSIEHLSGVLLACSLREEYLRKILVKARAQSDPAILYDALRLVQTEATETYSREKAEALFLRFTQQGTCQVPTLVGIWNVPPARAESSFDYPGLKFTPFDLHNNLSAGNTCCLDRTIFNGFAFEDAEKVLEIIQTMHSQGVEFMAGTDAPNFWAVAGRGLHEELALFVKAGFTPMEALQTATRNPAKYLGMLDWLGTVEEGKAADLVLLEANPLEEIRNTQKIAAIILQGKLILKEELLRIQHTDSSVQ